MKRKVKEVKEIETVVTKVVKEIKTIEDLPMAKDLVQEYAKKYQGLSLDEFIIRRVKDLRNQHKQLNLSPELLEKMIRLSQYFIKTYKGKNNV